MDEAGWEMQDQADRELQQMMCEALDRCLKAGAKQDDLKLLAWQAGLTNWKPTEQRKVA
jgi:hypothetical protein